jgi:hypothetical protein
MDKVGGARYREFSTTLSLLMMSEILVLEHLRSSDLRRLRGKVEIFAHRGFIQRVWISKGPTFHILCTRSSKGLHVQPSHDTMIPTLGNAYHSAS